MPRKTDKVSDNFHAICPLCVRVVSKDNEEKARSIVKKHNEQLHDGEEVSQVVGPGTDDLNTFIDDMKNEYGAGSDVYEKIAQHITKVDPWGILND